MPWYGFLPFNSERMRMTYERIKSDLNASNGLLFRNRDQDEGVFLLCSLWSVEYLARGGGSLKEAKDLFEHILTYVNDVGLLSEEADPATGDLLGNFPLTFSHLGLINAILALDWRMKTNDLSLERPVYALG
jgi:GH15 family glucan-1,4-alpha-glucosidase